MAELKWHNTRKSQFLVIARIMPFFCFSNEIAPILTINMIIDEELSHKKLLLIVLSLWKGGSMRKSKGSNLTVIVVNKPNIDGLPKDEARVLYRSLLDQVLKLGNSKESEEN